ncbi:NUDIX hydrolase [Georgenia satyanarayanai]|uniref:NUDIX hydrolase n=1 Tax=Georgenia satyanarayanai TaxID=860221 RepID=UPI0012652639|nr:NUDIX domain-containing protein [Georgenia satyanarayanai]
MPPTLHSSALAVLETWHAPTPRQEQLRERYVAHLRAEPLGVLRECYPDHLTASTVVVSADRRSVLLTLHRKAQRWFQLGGHVEPGDPTLAAAALREAREESGIDALVLDPVPVQLSAHPVPFCDPRGGATHLDVRFVATAPVGAAHAVSAESLDVAWWPVDELPDPQPDMVELVALALARLA